MIKGIGFYPVYSHTRTRKNNRFYANMPNFTGNAQLTELEKSFIQEGEIRIPNILELNQDIKMPYSQMPQDKKKYNVAGLNIKIKNDGNSKKYEISNDKGDILATIKTNKDAKDLPIIVYKQGKFMPELTVKDSSLKGKSIKKCKRRQLWVLNTPFRFRK